MADNVHMKRGKVGKSIGDGLNSVGTAITKGAKAAGSAVAGGANTVGKAVKHGADNASKFVNDHKDSFMKVAGVVGVAAVGALLSESLDSVRWSFSSDIESAYANGGCVTFSLANGDYELVDFSFSGGSWSASYCGESEAISNAVNAILDDLSLKY